MMAQAQAPSASRWEQMFGLDYRSLSAARFMLGMLIIVDLVMRAEDLTAHYTDDGVHPREQAFGVNGFYVCLHMMNGEWYFQAFLFVLHGIIALSFALGYRTHLSAFFLWVLTSSLHARNHFVLYGGYVMMRLLTVWFVFLPSGRAWSLDTALQKEPTTPGPSPIATRVRSPWHVSGFSVAYLLQMAVLYMSSAWHKTGNEWRTDYTAAWYAISLDYFRWGFGDLFLSHPALLSALTFATLYWELYGPYLFFSPFWPQLCRFVSVLGFWFLHFGLALSLRLSVFLPTFTTALVAMLPAFVWDSIIIPFFSTHARARLRVQYDPSSSFATLLAQISRFLLVGPCTIQHMTGETKDVYFRVLDPPLQHTEPSLALVAVVSHSPLAWPLAPLLRLSVVQSWFDAYAAREFERDKHKRPGAPPRSFFKLPPVRLMRKMFTQLLGIALALGVLSWCMGNTGSQEYSTPANARPLLLWLHLDQMWNLFAPRPPPGNFWYTIPGELENGTQIELWKDSAFFYLEMQPPVNPATYRPEPFAAHFLNSRWYKWFENVNEGREEILLPFGRWICRRWNAKYHGGERLYQYRIISIWEMNNPNGTRTRAGNNTLWWHVCYDRETPKPTDENGEVIENRPEEEPIRPLKEELQLEGEDLFDNQEQQAVEEGAHPNSEQKEHKDDLAGERREEVQAHEDAATDTEAKEEKGEETAEEKDGQQEQEQEQRAQSEQEVQKDGSEAGADTEETKMPFRRPIERLKEIEEEDRQRKERIDNLLNAALK